MALVKVLVANLFAGASFQKLEAGKVYDVDDAVAEKWIDSGKAEKSTEKKGEALNFGVASAPSTADTTEIQGQLDAALAEVKSLKEAAETSNQEHAEALAAETKRADTAEAALAEATKKAK